MHLQKLEIQGFKSFAQRVVLEFPSAKGTGKGITAVVGPNGSGKSNIADAIRWVLGEQSMKTLRGKKSEDVIFFGSDKKARVGMAEVSLYLSNEDRRAPVDYSELVITRRLYRNGESEYLLNKQKVRLSDIQILLAQANFGQRTYSVIGQGMVDHFLVASQAERKEFFDEAAGVKEFQIKKNHTLSQLDRATENLQQTDITLQELGPRYRSLSRLVKRAEQREGLEVELRELQRAYYGEQYRDLAGQVKAKQQQTTQLKAAVATHQTAVAGIQTKLDSLEQAESGQEVLERLQQQFTALSEQKNKLHHQQLELQHQLAVAKQQASQQFVPLSANAMAAELEALVDLHQELTGHADKGEHESIKKKLGALLSKLQALIAKVRRPQAKDIADDPATVKELAAIEKQLPALEKELAAVQQQLRDFSAQQAHKQGEFFDLQRQFVAAQNQLNTASLQLNDIQIELARLETRQQDLTREINNEFVQRWQAAAWEKELTDATATPPSDATVQIQRLKHQLEVIGGVDDESLREFEEIKGRFEFLQTQYDDLTKAVASLQEIMVELDAQIHDKFDITFNAINEKFGEYFQKLFGGGKANLEKLMIAVDEDAAEADEDEDGEADEAELPAKKKDQKLQYGGVEIRACPPGKKISNLNTLSGGERAMTSIGLICAIIASNPSPFVVLDEVDAALDEANSDRYSAILEELSSHTQFIVVTHNRSSMRRADVLYGVTMGDDSASSLLSVKLEEGEQWAK